jgi:hypothetical protein
LANVSQARIRTINMVMGAPNTTVYVNGLPALNGDREQKDIPVGLFSGFLYVKPGTYTIALVPDGTALDQALFKPVDVKAEAGHRYTVAAIGQLADKDIHPLVVDETSLEAGLHASPSDIIMIDIVNSTGVDSVTEQAYGITRAENIKSGDARAWFAPSGNLAYTTLVNVDGTSTKIDEGIDPASPGTSVVLPWYGSYPPDSKQDYSNVGHISQGTSELNVVDFLAGFTGPGVKMDGHLVEFKTLLDIIRKAGLHDQLVDDGPYYLLAPTDEAFSKLSQADLDVLLSDSQAAKKFLDGYIIDGYYPSGNLSGAKYGHADRILSSRSGQELAFKEEKLNHQPTGRNYTVGNGIRLTIIFTLLSPK